MEKGLVEVRQLILYPFQGLNIAIDRSNSSI